MNYWCYFLSQWDTVILNKITKKYIITTPTKHKFIKDDIIFLYNRQIPRGFYGYARIDDNLVSNIEKTGKYIHEFFKDNAFNNFYANLKYIKFFKKPIERNKIFLENKDLLRSFISKIKMREYILQLPNDIGVLLRKYMKGYVEIDENEYDTNTENSDIENGEVEKDQEIVDSEPEIKSRFIIPMMIIPCRKLKSELCGIIGRNRVRKVFEHVSNCKKCDLTNNNERVSFDMVNQDMPLYEMSDDDEIDTLLDIYYSLEYYKTRHFKMIEIINDVNDYFGCFCVIGRMNKAY